MSTNLTNIQHAADSSTSRAWYTVPVRSLFFKILAPFLVHLADKTSAVEARAMGAAARLEEQAAADRAATAALSQQVAQFRGGVESQSQSFAALSEQVTQVSGSYDKVRQQLLVLDGLRKDQMAVGSRLGSLEDTLGRLDDQLTSLTDRVAQGARHLAETDERLRLVRVLEETRDTSQADLASRLAQVAQQVSAANEQLRLVRVHEDARDLSHADVADRIAQLTQRLADTDEQLRHVRQVQDSTSQFQGIATLPRETTLAIAGTSLVVHDGPYGRFLLRHPDLISDHVTRGGFWDAYLKPIIERTGRPDRCAIDAGAYLGFHSVYMSRYFGTVYSFEPQLEMYRMLCANLLLNNCRNVVAENRALYDVQAHMRIARRELQEIPVPGEPAQPAYDVIGNAAALAFELVSEPDEHSVPSTTIDALGLTTLGLLKVDTQGSDLNVLRGARETIVRCRPTIVTEFERELTMAHRHTYDDYLAFFAEVGYEVSVLEDRSSGKQIDLLAEPR